MQKVNIGFFRPSYNRNLWRNMSHEMRQPHVEDLHTLLGKTVAHAVREMP